MSYSYNFNKPLWDPSNFTNSGFSMPNMMFNNIGGFQMPIWGGSSFSSSTSSTNTNKSSYEIWKEKALKEQEEEAKNKAFQDERSKEIEKTKDLIEHQDKTIKAIKGAKKENGNYVIETSKLQEPVLKDDGTIDKEAMKPKKKGFFGKAMEWVGSAGSALKNMGKSLIGYDENGKWSWKKCLKNAAITAAAVGASFIPVVGPAIGYGLLAYGVVSGGIGVAKGISKLNNATTEEEREQARQDVCSGAFVGISSAAGLKGLGKSVSTAAKTSGTNTTTLGVSAVAKARNGIGKPVQIISQFIRDISVNALKATGKAMKNDKNLVGSIGWRKTYVKNVKTAMKNVNNFKHKYQDKYKEMETSLNNKITDLNNKITTETNPAKKALLVEQRVMFENNLNELRSISGFKSKTKFDKLSTTNSGIKNQEKLGSYTQSSGRGYEINGRTVSQKMFEAFKKEIEASQAKYIKDLKKLNSYKEGYMRSYARKPDSHKYELDNYTDASIRAKYNTKAKLKEGIKNLNEKLNDFNTKIAELKDKIARATSSRKKASLNRSLNNYIAQKSKVETELSICNSIKFKSLFKTSTWFKNDYSRYIGGSNASFNVFRNITAKTLTAPAVAAPFTMAQWDREYSTIPYLSPFTELSAEDGKAALEQAEQQKTELEKTLNIFKEADTLEKWEALKAKYAAQAQAQQEAVAAASQGQRNQIAEA